MISVHRSNDDFCFVFQPFHAFLFKGTELKSDVETGAAVADGEPGTGEGTTHWSSLPRHSKWTHLHCQDLT
jgi:hypothetical protein